MEIHELTERQSTLDTGVYLPVDDGDVTQKIDYPRLAQAIIEQYTASSLGGSYRSIKTALDAIKTTVDGKVNTSDVVNNLVTTAAGKVLDARQGKTLNDAISTLNTNAVTQTNIPLQTLGSVDNLPANSVGWVNAAAVSGGIPNLPTQSAYHIMTAYTISNTYGFQLARHYEDGTLWSRVKHNGTWSGWERYVKQSDVTTKHTWTPHIYDSDTKVRELAANSASYFRFGNICIGWINVNNINYSGISTMLQFRNLPCSRVLGGSVYFATFNDGTQGGSRTIQCANHLYIRPNTKSTDFSNPATSGWTSIFFVGVYE